MYHSCIPCGKVWQGPCHILHHLYIDASFVFLINVLEALVTFSWTISHGHRLPKLQSPILFILHHSATYIGKNNFCFIVLMR